jgi:hypothetical protein
MERRIYKSVDHSAQAVVCILCDRKVHYHDKLDDEGLVCLSCSYAEGFIPAEDCIYNGKEFDPHDPELRVEMTRIAQIDIDRADPVICTRDIVIPEDLWEPLSRLMRANGSTLNAEIINALGWYSTMCLNKRSSAPIDFTNVESIKAESAELREILGADDSGVHAT